MCRSNSFFDWRLFVENGQLLRNGSFGKLYRCTRGDLPVAVKCSPSLDEGLKEVAFLKLCNLPFVAQFIDSQIAEQKVYIAMEFCPVDLYDVCCRVVLTARDIAFYSAEIAIGLHFIHSRNVIHGDIKPENICISETGHIKIIDFGCSTQLQNPQEQKITKSGTLQYADPQTLSRVPHGMESDWWSFGVLLFELLFLTLPFNMDDEISDTERCNRICSASLQFPSFVEETIHRAEHFQFVAKLLDRDPITRIHSFQSFVENVPSSLQVNWADGLLGSLEPPQLQLP